MKVIIEIDGNEIPPEGVTVKIFPYGVHAPGKKRERVRTTWEKPKDLTDIDAADLINKAAWQAVNWLGKVKQIGCFHSKLKVELFEVAQEYLLERTGIHQVDHQKMFTSARNRLNEVVISEKRTTDRGND